MASASASRPGAGNRFLIISGCSGGGKSTLLSALSRRGHAVIEEPGLRIVRKETSSGGGALPWRTGCAPRRSAAPSSSIVAWSTWLRRGGLCGTASPSGSWPIRTGADPGVSPLPA
ncbi:AAA family ATPase [Lutibaculum baratangense]|uniref:AAA family ATPase n=1 Tax=Lutibaculum baratangense TaxID=1358440 RepID=UPI0009DFF634